MRFFFSIFFFCCFFLPLPSEVDPLSLVRALLPPSLDLVMQPPGELVDPRKSQLAKPLPPPPPLSPRSAAAAAKQESQPTPAPAPASAPQPPPTALRKRANTEDYLMLSGASKPKREGHTFEQFLVVGIPHNADLSRVPARYEPQILYQWPTDVRYAFFDSNDVISPKDA